MYIALYASSAVAGPYFDVPSAFRFDPSAKCSLWVSRSSRVRVRVSVRGRVRIRVRGRVRVRLRLGQGVVGSVHVATPGSAHGTCSELQLFIIP